MAMYRNGKFFAIHTDHLGTPRLMTNEENKPVWQWPYSAFGNNKPTGVLKATANPKAAITTQPLLKATNPQQELDLGMPGHLRDEETGWMYSWHRYFWPMHGVFGQMDPIGLAGGLNRSSRVDGNALSVH